MPRIAVDKVEPDPSTQKEKSESPTDKDLEEKSGTSVLAAFQVLPRNITFSGKYEKEEIVLLLRAHIVTNLPWMLLSLAALVIPLILVPFLGVFGLPVGSGSAVAFILLWYAGIFTYAFLNFLYWYFNVYIVTSERVVDIDWYSIIYKKISATQISKVQDVHASQGGVFAGMFDYGEVEIQTAGTEINFEFTTVPHPQLVAKKIHELMP